MSGKETFLAQYGTEDHINKLMSIIGSNSDLNYPIAKNHLLSHEHMTTIVNDKNNWEGHLGLSTNPSIPTSIVSKLTKHSDSEIQGNALLHKNVDPNDIDKALDTIHTPASVVSSIVQHSPHITIDQLKQIAYPRKGRDYHSYIKDLAYERLDKEESKTK